MNFNTMNVMVYEVLEQANAMLKTDKQQAIQLLRSNRSRVVIEGLLKMNYDPSIVFQLPPGNAPVKRQTDVPDGYCLTDLKQEFRRLHIFTDKNLNLTKVRREQLWLQMCEGLFWKESDLINKIKDRRLTDIYGEFTPEVVNEIFPGLLPASVAPPVPEEAIAPIDYGPDPSLIPEDELVKESVKEYVSSEIINGNLTFDEWRKQFFDTTVAVRLRETFSSIPGFNVEGEVERAARTAFASYLTEQPESKKAVAVADVATATAKKSSKKPATRYPGPKKK